MNEFDFTEKFEKEFLEKYSIYRDHIKHEDNLANQRLSFFIASQSFLLFPYFSILKDYKANGYNCYDLFLLFIVCCLGLFLSSAITPAIQGFVDATSAINRVWKLYYLQSWIKHGEMSAFKYGKDDKEEQDDKLLDTDITDISKDDLAFLKVNKVPKSLILPNIRHESSNKKVNDGFFKCFYAIPKWFRFIWILFFIIPLLLHICFYNDESNFRGNLENIIIKSNQDLILEIEQEHNKKLYINQEIEKLSAQVIKQQVQIDNLKQQIDERQTSEVDKTSKN